VAKLDEQPRIDEIAGPQLLIFIVEDGLEPHRGARLIDDAVDQEQPAVVAFLRDLAPGPVAAGEIERLAVASGLLGKGKPLGQSKIFRTARKSLGIKTYQKPGERAGGWIWSWPDQMIDLDRRVAKRHVLTEMAGVDQGHNKAAPYSQLIWDRRLDPERITLEQWILYEAHDKQFGEWPDVGPRPGVARCEMPAALQKTLGYTPVAPVR
jgi:hypothetical protein